MDNLLNFWINGGPDRAVIEREQQENSGDVLRDNINNYTIDSCSTFDEGHETAIWYKDNDMVIVERYKNKENMKIGHKKWCDFCKENPKEVFSVQYGETISLVKEDKL